MKRSSRTIRKRRSRGNGGRGVVVLVLVLVALAVVFWWPHGSNDTSTEGTSTATNATADATETSADDSAADSATSTSEYRNEELGFRLEYPTGWEGKTNTSGDPDSPITNFSFGDGTVGVILIVLPEGLEGIVRDSVSIDSETTVIIHGEQATRVLGTENKDGQRLALLFFDKDATVYVLNGTPDLVDTIGATFMFIAEE